MLQLKGTSASLKIMYPTQGKSIFVMKALLAKLHKKLKLENDDTCISLETNEYTKKS